MAMPTTPTSTRTIPSIPITLLTLVVVMVMTFTFISPTTTAMEIATLAMVMPMLAWGTTAVKRSVITTLIQVVPATIPSTQCLTMAMMPMD